MKRTIGTIFAIALVFGITGIRDANANKNEENAKKRCAELKEQGIECKVSKWVGCGPSWKKDKEFRGKGKDWFSCVRTATHKSYERGGNRHQAECKAFCERNPDCKKCKEGNACGTGYKVGKRFSGPGRNWVACFRSNYGDASDENKAACERWCKEHKCAKCSKIPTCGSFYRAAKTFGGKGKNWYACFKDYTR